MSGAHLFIHFNFLVSHANLPTPNTKSLKLVHNTANHD